MYKRPLYNTLLKRLSERRRLIQVLVGPRQVGKTTLIQQLLEKIPIPNHYASADAQARAGMTWIEQQWEIGRMFLKKKEKNSEALLVLDEVQKIQGWSEMVKRLWDEDTREKRNLKVVLLGSSPLLIQSGVTESLTGRFEVIPVTHWSFQEMKEAFGWDLNRYLYFGAYPGGADFIEEEERWKRYIIDSLIETTLSKDILLMTRIDKPALLRQLFHLGCEYSSQILSYQKMTGQLHDAGNTTTLAHYLELLSGAGLLTGLSKFTGSKVRERGSSPKLQVLNTALMTVYSDLSFTEAIQDRNYWGRVVESAVGATLGNSIRETSIQLFYWRERGKEVDFILKKGKRIVAIEVKSSRFGKSHPGMEAFSEEFGSSKKLLVGDSGIPLEEFLSYPIEFWFDEKN